MKVCVIGAGVIGLTIAYELSSRGHAVTVVEREEPFAGASRRSFAWVNANNKFPASYHRLNAAGIEAHEKLQECFPSDAVWLHRSGNLLADFSAARPDTYAARSRDAEANGYPVRTVGRDELATLEPAIPWPKELDSALFYPDEGYLDNDVLAEELLAALGDQHVTFTQAEVARLESSDAGARVHFSAGQPATFDRAVIAAGADSGTLAESSGFVIPVADLGTPTTRTHSLLGLTAPVGLGLSRVVISDRVNVRPRHDGRLWVQVPRVEHRVEEGESPELLREVGAVLEDELERLFEATVPVEGVIFSGRSFPEDGVSIIGYVDDPQKVYCAVTHSGMTLAALFGRLTAEELEGAESDLLADFRPSRFANGIVRTREWDFIGRQ